MQFTLPLFLILTFIAVSLGTTPPATASDDEDGWPVYSYDNANTNYNPTEDTISAENAANLRRAWETFNDDTFVPEPPPTGFVLEGALGLTYRSSVVGIVASPIIQDDTIYYIDQLGTVFARDAESGQIVDSDQHWTTTLVDPDFDAGDPAVLPELIFTAPVVTEDFVWIAGSAYGRLHAVSRSGGQEIDFDSSTPEIDPLPLITDLPFSSVLGDSVIVETEDDRTLFIAGINIILNDALVQGQEGGLQIAFDISDPFNPFEAWRTYTIDIDPATMLRYSTGVSAGAGLAVDEERGWIFGGTGQNTSLPYPEYPDPAFAPAGFIDRSDSLYAIDYSTGDIVWTNQFHNGDVFNLNAPVSTGPNNPDGPRDADVLSPPVLYSIDSQDFVSDGSKGGLYRAVDRDTGVTIWERQISKRTGIGGIQAGAAFADGVLYVAGFEGIDDGFSDAQFGSETVVGNFPNAFFATFSPAFWADVEDVAVDDDPATGMRIKLYALDGATGESVWDFGGDVDFVELLAGAALRHVSVANGLVYVTSSSGQLFVLNAANGEILFSDQTPDLNALFSLGLGKPQHASMNSGTLISDGMVFAPYGGQNEPSGGIYAYELNRRPKARKDVVTIWQDESIAIPVLANDSDKNGDALVIVEVAGTAVNPTDGVPDVIVLPEGTLTVFNVGDDPEQPEAAYIQYDPTPGFTGRLRTTYVIEDVAPNRIINGVETSEPNPTHTPLQDDARLRIRVRS
jgi:outer membrane protein assembly factor BamB